MRKQGEDRRLRAGRRALLRNRPAGALALDFRPPGLQKINVRGALFQQPRLTKKGPSVSLHLVGGAWERGPSGPSDRCWVPCGGWGGSFLGRESSGAQDSRSPNGTEQVNSGTFKPPLGSEDSRTLLRASVLAGLRWTLAPAFLLVVVLSF